MSRTAPKPAPKKRRPPAKKTAKRATKKAPAPKDTFAARLTIRFTREMMAALEAEVVDGGYTDRAELVRSIIRAHQAKH